jgi:amino acid adenylation domain-containing protein
MTTEMLQGFDLSPQQKQIWLLAQLDSKEAYRSRCVFNVTGELEPEVLAMALRSLVERHEALRTRFELLPGMAQPLQVISKDPDFAYVYEDISALPMIEQALKCGAFLEVFGITEEDSEAQAVLSVKHLMLNREQHLLELEVSALNADARSLHLLGREIGMAYGSVLQERPLAEPIVQYVDVSETMNECLEKDEFDVGRQYWRERIASLEQSQGRQELVPNDFQPRVFRIQEADQLWGTAESFCARLGVSRESFLLACWGLVSCRMEGAAEAAMSVCCDGRMEDVLLDVIGLLSRPVPFLFLPKPAGSFEDVVLDVHRLLVELSDEQLYFDPMILNEAAGDNRTQQISFEYLRLPAHDIGEGHAFSLESLLTVTDRYRIKLTAIEIAGKLRCQLEYDENRITENEVQRIWGSLRTMFESALNDPARRVELLEVLSAEAKEQLTEYARGEEIEWDIESVHGMVEAQADARPDGVAIVYEGEYLSYEELNRRGNQLGNYLKRHGVGVEQRVGLYLERSVELMIGALGVLKSGGVYVPLDPSYPKERLKYMLEEAGALVVLTQERLEGTLTSNSVKEICLDKEWGKIGEERASKIDVKVEAENLAYVIYTSGSSGRPKGVMIPHRSVCNHMRWMQRLYPLGSEDRMLQKTAIGFDAAGTELWLPLSVGGTVVVARDGGQRDVEYLGRAIWEEGVTILQVVPTLLREMVGNEKGLTGGSPLRLVYSGGELLTAELAEKFMRTTTAELCNLYGPTEATIDASGWEVRRTERVERVPIGRPVTNSRVCVLDKEMQLVPIGVTGEIYIGGTAVGRGYLNRADMTAEKYLPSILGEQGERLYRSGDHGRVASGGELEYLGRIDEQVKVRGYRIELGEIEAVMAGHEGVKQCAVVERENGRGEKQLVGYVVPMSIESVSIAEIRSYLGEQLPDYMVPAAIVQIEAMPLTSNGKLDRKALPGTDFSSQKASFIAPQGAVEEILCDIWSEVLRVERVGIHDNFFELGGHSLLAMQVVSRIRGVLGVEVSLRSLFSDPTPAAIAAEVEQQQKMGEKASAPPLVKVARDQNLPLSFAQQRLWLIDQLRPGNTAYNIPFAVRLSGNLDAKTLYKSFNEIVSRHEVLRTSFPFGDGEPSLKISSVADVRLEFVDLINTDESEQRQQVREVVESEAGRDFDLSNGPLIRAKLIRVAEAEHVLVVSMHHIVSDGWSMEVIIREFFQLYEAFSQGQESPLPELDIQYADYAVWQRTWLQGGVLENQLQYWKEKLDGVTVLEMPTDRPRPAIASYHGASEKFSLSRELSAELRQMSRREGVTLFMSLLAGFQVVLSRHSGQLDIAVGTPIAGRNQRETEGLIGFFVNTLVMRVDVGGSPTVSELLTRVRETALGAYMHQDMPFDKIVEELRPERSLSHQPLFQVIFMMQNVPRETSSIRGISMKNEPMELRSAKFELELSIVEAGGEIQCALDYATELYDGWRIRRLLGHLEQVLKGMTEDGNRRVMALQLMTEAEWQEVVFDWNQTATDYPRDRCVRQLFEQQVELMPDAVAVVHEAGRLSYHELNRRANQLAHYLRKFGVGAEVKVGLCMERSQEMIVGLLAVMKAGGAYLPLDPVYPPERLSYMIEDAKVAVVVTRSALYKGNGAGGPRVLNLTAEWEQISECAESEPEVEVSEEMSAYIIYTSGTTGLPKGVQISHGALTNFLNSMQLEPGFRAGDSLMAVTSLSFDIAGLELYLPLLTGGSIVLAGRQTRVDGGALAEALGRHRVNVMQATPTTWRMLIEAGWSGAPDLKILCGGEALSLDLAEELLPRGASVWNMYGPTETTIWSTLHRIEDADPGVPIGRPIANTQVYIVDEQLNLLPVGAPGELVIGGGGLARGYWNRPDVTAEKFIPHPFDETEGARLYRTGDLARYRREGVIECLGRLDHQVKLRGHRIELGEIEAALQEHPSIDQAVVIARQEEKGEKRLVAYLVAGEELNRSDLKEYLKKRLPDYMAPELIVQLEELPLTANGKIDRKALPRPEAGIKVQYAGPQTEMESILCGIWAEVLRVERVGVLDNFFDLGGNSLSAFRVISRLRRALDIEMPLLSLFETGTISEFAKRIEDSKKSVPRRKITRVDRNAYRAG